MEKSVEVLAVMLFGILGLSHILQAKGWAEFWAEFFISSAARGKPAPL
jgi:hypothetical protein